MRSGPALTVLWGKSNAGGRPNPLLQHLFDTAAVGELVWDRYLAPSIREKIDLSCGGAGRSLFVLLCGLHDVGKAAPAFQCKAPDLAATVQAAGLTWTGLTANDKQWHHTLAGAVILRPILKEAGWGPEQVSWVLPMISGHHGRVPAPGRYAVKRRPGHGLGPAWRQAQTDLVQTVADALEVDLSVVAPVKAPSRAIQLAVSGGIIMADWIASGQYFAGVSNLSQVSIFLARQRAEQAWRKLGLHGGWSKRVPLAAPGFFQERFLRDRVRPVQQAAIDAAWSMPAPGLVVLEAPMGEGKTEAALAAAEVLAARFGCDGAFVGMPTQATSDAMFERVVTWASRLDPGTPPGLLHGKRRFNKRWYEMRKQARFAGIDDDGDEYGCGDDYGPGARVAARVRSSLAPAEWFLGRKLGLLMPVTIGTIDQLLQAATRTRHVMLRHLGLAGRVVILDEVHACDVYMMRFLTEALRWLGDAGVPVVLLSATLPPAMRAELAGAYLQGATRQQQPALPPEFEQVSGYPVVRWLSVADGRATAGGTGTPPWRAGQPVAVEVLGERPAEEPDRVVAVLRQALAEGGCALVVRNTVGRAQQTYRAVKEAFAGTGTEVVLLHARLTMGDRVTCTERVLKLLGAPDRSDAPARPSMVVVATQLAEQSFDVDVDLLITDLAPIDLLLQRAGRLHRHERPVEARPGPVRSPRMVVAGMAFASGGTPVFPRGSEYVYGRYLLLMAAALVDEAAGGSWLIPDQVPDLVRRGYDGGLSLPVWQAETEQARRDWAAERVEREAKADQFVLAGPLELNRVDLAGLHERRTRDLEDDDAVAAVVRDGPRTIEVVLLRRRGDLKYTLDGRCLGPGDTAISSSEVAESVLASSVRLPPRLTDEGLRELLPLAEAGDDPWLARARVLELDETGAAQMGGRRLTYHPELGLCDEPAS